MAEIAVIDYGMGNLHSVRRALEHVTADRVRITRDPAVIAAADRVVFPGQGAIGHCMAELERLELTDLVRRQATEKPFLGICLGPQALLEFSEENGGTPCLGVLPGRVTRFPADLVDAQGGRLKIPHMGWNRVQQSHPHPLWAGIEDQSWFYFVHSYYLDPTVTADLAGTSGYGIEFAAAVARENLFAVQFHPEKSARDGLRLLANFAAWRP